ncbi:unnamed protein product [Lampetra fluviatilis]
MAMSSGQKQPGAWRKTSDIVRTDTRFSPITRRRAAAGKAERGSSVVLITSRETNPGSERAVPRPQWDEISRGYESALTRDGLVGPALRGPLANSDFPTREQSGGVNRRAQWSIFGLYVASRNPALDCEHRRRIRDFTANAGRPPPGQARDGPRVAPGRARAGRGPRTVGVKSRVYFRRSMAGPDEALCVGESSKSVVTKRRAMLVAVLLELRLEVGRESRDQSTESALRNSRFPCHHVSCYSTILDHVGECGEGSCVTAGGGRRRRPLRHRSPRGHRRGRGRCHSDPPPPARRPRGTLRARGI